MSTLEVMVLGLIKMWPVWVTVAALVAQCIAEDMEKRKKQRHLQVVQNREEYYTPIKTAA